MELVVFVTVTVMVLIVPFGTTGACFALYKFIKRRQRLKRYAIEFHTVFLTLIVVIAVVPLTNGRLILSSLQSDSVTTVKIFHTVTMQILQVVQLCNVIVIASKRARTMTQTVRPPSVIAEIVSILMCWTFGIILGVTPTIAAFKYEGNSTNGVYPKTSKLRHRTAFDAIYAGLLLMTSLVMFVACLSVRRHINSTIAGSSAAGRSLADRVYTIGALAKGLGDNLALQFVTTYGRRTTVISGPVMEDENGVVTSKVVVDNRISEKPTTERYMCTDTVSTASYVQNDHSITSGLDPKSVGRPGEDGVSFSLINIPMFGAVNSFDAIREDTDEDGRDIIQDDDIIERPSLTICAHPKQDNLSIGDRCPSPILFPDLWKRGRKKEVCSDEPASCSVSGDYIFCDDNDQASVTSHCKCTGCKTPRSHTPCTSPTSSIKNSLSPIRQRNSEGETDHDTASIYSRSSFVSCRRNNSIVSPSCSDKCFDVLSTTSERLYHSKKSNRSNTKLSSTSKSSAVSLSPLKHTRCSPSNTSFRSPTSLLRRSSSDRRSSNKNRHSDICESDSARDSGIELTSEKQLSWTPCDDKENVASNSKDAIMFELPETRKGSTQTDQSISERSVIAPCLPGQSSPHELSREGAVSYENRMNDNHTPAVQIRVTRPSTESVFFLRRRNGLVHDLGRPTNVVDSDYTKRQSKRNPRYSTVRKMTLPLSRNQSTSESSFRSNSSRHFSLQQGNIDSLRAPFTHKTRQYKETVVRRFILAFVINVLTQIPNVVLEISETSEVTYCILSPIFQSIALVSFLLSPYIYVLGNKIIHKTMTMRMLY